MVRDIMNAPRFWDFHRQPGGVASRTGLFRYLDDREASELLKALNEAALDMRGSPQHRQSS